MNNQEFDDAIRNKLEGVGQTFTEADIDKVFKHVTTAKPTFWQWLRGHWYLPVITLVSISAVVVFLFVNKSDSPDFNNAPVKEVVSTISPVTPEIQDTVQPSHDAEKTISAVNHNLPVEKVISEHESGNQQVKSKAGESKMNASQALQNKIRIHKSESKSGIKAYYSDKPVAEAAKVESPAVTPHAQEIIKDKQEISVSEKIADTSDRYQPEYDEPARAVNETVLKPEGNSLSSSEQPIKDEGKSEKKSGNDPAPKKKPDLRMPEFKGLNLSAAYNLGNLGFGPALKAKLMFGKGFGFTSGVRYLTAYKEQFNSREELDKDKHHHVHPGIKDHFHDNDMFSDIIIKNQLLQVPLMLTYSLPLKKQFTLDFQLGTEWDVYINQKIDLEQRTDTSGKHPGHFRESGNAVPFNNIVFSAGLSRQWKKFSFQVSPFISPSLKNVFYKPREIEFGVSAGFGYLFGK